jgi:hypothetical protein
MESTYIYNLDNKEPLNATVDYSGLVSLAFPPFTDSIACYCSKVFQRLYSYTRHSCSLIHSSLSVEVVSV